MKRHHLPPYHWSIIWKQSMQLWLPFISPLASCRFEIGRTDWFTIRNAHFQGLLCFRVLTFSEFFMNNFRKAARLPIKFYLTSEFWILFFFLNCWKKCPPERECHPLPFSAPAKQILISILPRRNLPLLSSRVSFLIPFFSFRSPLPTSEIQGSWVKLHYCAPSDRHHYKVYLFI